MRKFVLLTLVVQCFVLSAIHGQRFTDPRSSFEKMQGPAAIPRSTAAYSNFVNINGQDGFYLKKDLYLSESYTVINGEKVLGTPFLFLNWLPGTISTPDGRVYSDYLLKYNAFDQTAVFLNGKDSMDVNEEIKEFSLVFPWNDSAITTRFINSNQYQRGKTFYYQLLLDDNEGQLLKTNQKVLANMAEGIISSGSKKYLEIESAFYYYDKKTKKISKLKDSNIVKVLQLTDEQAKNLKIDSFDLTSEADIISLVKQYFQQRPKLGF